jgi:DNA-binding transcriptional LysR family regulator
VVEYARRILRLVDEAEAAVGDLLGLRRGRLVLGASTTPGTYLLPQLMGAFRDRHPDAELHLRIGDTREVERWVLKGELDFGVIGETREQLGLSVTPLTRDELVLVTPRKHPLSRGPLDGERLAGQPLIVREEGSSTRETLERALASRALALRVLFELGSTEAILSAVEAGLGASVVSSLAVADRRPPRVVVRRVTGLDLTRHLAVVVHPDARPSPLAREFLDFLSRSVSRARVASLGGNLAAAWAQP